MRFSFQAYYGNLSSLSIGSGSKYLAIISSFTSSNEDGDHLGFLSLSINNARTPAEKHHVNIYYFI